MATRVRHADGSTTAYEAMPLRHARARNKANAVRFGLTMDGPYADSDELLLDVYLDLMQQYEAIERGYQQLPELDEKEKLLSVFLTDADYCGFAKDSDAYKALMPNHASSVRWFVLLGHLATCNDKPDNWREWLEPGFYFE